MKHILVLGAGRSSSSLIHYLLENAEAQQWQVTVGDYAEEAAREKVKDHPHGKALSFNVHDPASGNIIEKSDIVISLLPADFHPQVADRCIYFKKHMLSASYVSEKMRSLDASARSAGILLLNECGLDPGIDHMSAMQVIDRIRKEGGKLTSFESFTGGLIAPETDPENPWRYKFTWNPRNVVMAGQSTAKFLENGKFKYIPYQQLFTRTTDVEVPGYGSYEGYANRDSLKYRDTYALNNVETILRGTLRHKGFCEAWNVFVQLGCCDDSYEMERVEQMTHLDFIESFLPAGNQRLEEKLKSRFGTVSAKVIQKFTWSGFFDREPVGLKKGTPAQILENILNKKWKLTPSDKDQIVMWHRFRFNKDGKQKEIQASLVATGDDSVRTAMAKTVGLPLAVAAKLLAMQKIDARGVQIPTLPEFYNPILEELNLLGITLREEEK